VSGQQLGAIPCPCGSGKMFNECHGAIDRPKLVEPKLPLAPPPVTRKLDLACGQSPRDGFEGVDIWEGAKHRVNLMRYPWPFEDNSVLELNCSHYIEHIPLINIDAAGNQVGYDELAGSTTRGQDALLRFFDEAYRILVPEGWFHVTWPALRSDRAFQDPTHRRFIPEAMLFYLSKKWRELNKLDHYNVRCNFEGDWGQSYDSALNARVDEVRQLYFRHYWNGVMDFTAKLKAIK